MNVVNWGLIGTGDIVQKRVAAALRNADGSELVSVCRGNAALAAETAQELGARRSYADWQELVADDEINSVYIATPVYLHAEQTVGAAEAGKHVLCEKPMALNVAECDSMIAACKANKVKLGVAYYRHFYPVVDRVKNVIASGEIGTVSLVQINAFEHFNPTSDDPRHWFVQKAKSGGGPMMDFGCHRLEVLVNLFGKVDRIASVVSASVYDREIEDTAVTTLHFASGVTATVSVTHATSIPKDTLQIYGTQGQLDVFVMNTGDMLITARGSGARHESYPPAANLHEPLIEDFVSAVATDREPAVNGEAGRYVSHILEEIYAS